MLSFNEQTQKSTFSYEAMRPEDMYWFDEAFGRKSVHDSKRDVLVCTIMGEMEVMHVIRRGTARLTERPELSLIDSIKEYVTNEKQVGILQRG